MKWKVRVQAIIDDEMEVEGDEIGTEEQAIEAAHADWRFVEAHSWEAEVTERPDEREDDG